MNPQIYVTGKAFYFNIVNSCQYHIADKCPDNKKRDIN